VIRDDSGASVAGAKIILTEESKGLVRESGSNRDGSFLFPSLIAGGYSVCVQKEGFTSLHRHGRLSKSYGAVRWTAISRKRLSRSFTRMAFCGIRDGGVTSILPVQATGRLETPVQKA